jgi:hypothetical protein
LLRLFLRWSSPQLSEENWGERWIRGSGEGPVSPTRPNQPVWSSPSAILRALEPRVWLNCPANCCRARRQRGRPKSFQAQTAHRGLRLDVRHQTRLMGRARRALLRRRLLPASHFPAKMGKPTQGYLLGTITCSSQVGRPSPQPRASASEPAVCSEAAFRRMSTDTSGPLDGMPAVITLTYKVAPASEGPKKRPYLFQECLILAASLPG